MWFSTASNSHYFCLILIFLSLGGRIVRCSVVERGVLRIGLNSTSATSSYGIHDSSEHSSASQTVRETQTETISPIPIFTPGAFGIQPTIHSSNDRSTITTGPTSSNYQNPWGDQIIPPNSCSFVAPGGDIEYTPCRVSAGQVKLRFFPENHDNITYPATYYAADLGVTMTSPLVYMLFDTITGTNDCGPLGPTYSNQVVSVPLTDVSTLPPYADATTQERMGAQERQLTLSDLLNCPSATAPPPLSVVTNPHPTADVYNRCNPRIVFPHAASAIGYPYWRHCAWQGYRIGIYDPPGAVPPVTGLLPTTVATPYSSTYESPTALPAVTTPPLSTSATGGLVSPTTTAVVSVSQASQPEATAANVSPTQSQPPQPVVPQTTTSSQGVIPATTTLSNSAPTVPGTLISSNPPYSNPTITISSASPTPVQSMIVPSLSVSTLEINGQIVTASGSVITLPGNSGVTTLDLNKGLTVIYASATAIATVEGFIVSASPGGSTLLIGTQTLSAGGPVVTIGDSHVVATLDSSQLVVEYPSGTVSVYGLPTGVANVVTPGGPIQTTKAVPANIVIGSQTISLGGPQVTLSNNDVVTLGPSGLDIQMPGGGVGTIVEPTNPSEASTTALGNIIASFVGLGSSTPTTSTGITGSNIGTTQTTNATATMSLTTGSGSSSRGGNATTSTQTSFGTSSKASSSKTASSSVAVVTKPSGGNRIMLGCWKWSMVGLVVGLIYGW